MKTTTTDKPKADFKTVPASGAISRDTTHTSPTHPKGEQPADQAELDSVGRLLAPYQAARNLLLPEIVNLWTWGTSGGTLNSPPSADEKMELLGRLPDPLRLGELSGKLSAALDRTATPAECAEAVAMMTAIHPNLGAERGPFLAGLTFALTMEAEANRWAPCVIAAGVFLAVRKTKFVPTLAEVIEGIETADKQFQQVQRVIPRTVQAIEMIEDELIRLGVIVYPDDGMDF